MQEPLMGVKVLLTDIHLAAISDFEICGFNHVLREGNRVAHTLAHDATSVTCKIWRDATPDSLSSLLLADLA